MLVELGTRWERSLGTIAEEHFFGFYLRNKLGARFHHRGRNVFGPKIVMACLPGERHEIGLLLFALAVNETGYRPIVLGADMPLEELNAAADKTDSAAIILSGLLDPASDSVWRGIQELATDAEVPIFAGGQMSVRDFDALKRAGIEPLGADIDIGLKRLTERVPPGA